MPEDPSKSFLDGVLIRAAKGFAKFLIVDKLAQGKFRDGGGWRFLAIADGEQCGHQEVVRNVEVSLDFGFVEFRHPISREIAFRRAQQDLVYGHKGIGQGGAFGEPQAKRNSIRVPGAEPRGLLLR